MRTLRDYFNGLSDVLEKRAALGGDPVENIDVGTNREVICQEFLEKHIPRRFSINSGGDIFGVRGARSGQIDILVNHDMSINFEANHKIRAAVESVTAAVSVKSFLNKTSFQNALANLATIPQCHPGVIHLGPLKPNLDRYLLTWPSLYVFAFDSVDPANFGEYMTEYYGANPTPLNRVPRAIVVNGKSLTTFLQYNIPGADLSMSFDAKWLQTGNLNAAGRGSPLFWMMHELAKGLTWLDDLYLDYGQYYTEVYG